MEIIDIALFSLKIVQECHLTVEMVCILKKKIFLKWMKLLNDE